MPILHIDFETFAKVDLRKVGLENYVASRDFTVTVIAWAFDDGTIQHRSWSETNVLPDEVRQHIEAGGEIHAWNAAFEAQVIREHYGIPAAQEQFVCTMQRALAYGLPAGLLGAGKALRLATLKDETKRTLMLSMGRPRAKGRPPWHEVDPSRLATLVDYCCDDVNAERAIGRVIPMLHPFERKLSLLDAEINQKGVMLDLRAVAALRAAAGTALAGIDDECTRLTQGVVTAPGSQVARLMMWLATQGTALEDVSRDTVKVALAAKQPATVQRVLELRQQAAKSSVSKLDRMMDVASKRDHRARYLMQFYGAGRTGRWAGRLIQPQNLPRVPDGHVPDDAIELGAVNGLGEFYASPMDAISKTLRGCFVAEQGCVLVAVDLSQIEARVLAWLAGQRDVLEGFRRGDDVYTMVAKQVGSSNRQLGKVLVLACGYGMGAMKFRETAEGYSVMLTQLQADELVYLWRQANPAVVRFWKVVENAFIKSVQHPGAVVTKAAPGRGLMAQDLPFGMAVRTKDGVTQLRKPNGVKLTYHRMRIEDGGLVFDGVNSVTKQWGTQKTYGGKLVENMVQSVARDVMAEAMLAGDVPVLTVHDEIVWEVPEDFMEWEDRAELVATPTTPMWAPGLPVASKTAIGVRYAK